MFNMPGGPELLVIFLVALVVIGPQQLPKAMRTFGNVMAEVRKVSSSFQAEMKSAMDSVVDTSGNEKPHSGSMAPVEPVPTEVSDDPDEVVARNRTEPEHPIADPAAQDGPAGDATAAEAPARPAIDPADRAAG